MEGLRLSLGLVIRAFGSSIEIGGRKGFAEEPQRQLTLRLPSWGQRILAVMPYTPAEVRDFLSRARVLVEGAERRELTAAERLLERSSQLITEKVDRAMMDAAPRLATYDGLPLGLDLLGTLGVTHSEDAHNNMLAWMLDPDGDHGLGDSVLRRFLARLHENPLCGRTFLHLATSPGCLRAVVQREAPVGVGYLDILLLVSGVAVAIECKVWSEEHEITDAGRSAPQTTYYRKVLGTDAGRAQALTLDGKDLVGPAPVVIGVFVRPSGRPNARDDETTTISWLDIERDLGEAMSRRALSPVAKTLLEGFRSTLLQSTGSTEPMMPIIDHLRLLTDAPALRRANPMGTYLHLRTFLREDEHDG